MKLTGIEVSMCVHTLRTMAADCDKIVAFGFNATRPELTASFEKSAKDFRELADKLERADEVRT
jgi:hypothetical protein